MRILHRAWRTFALAAATAVVVGCSTYASHAPLIQEALVRDDYESAIKAVEKINKGNSELLYCYELGMVLHEQGDYAASNATFERAEQVLEELYTKSISREIGALTVSETIIDYRGDAFEAVIVNYYKILNYLFLQRTEDALVECRRLNQKLQLIHDAGETYFVNDPFLQYLTALVYEHGGEVQSAEVSYRTACRFYEADSTLVAPPWLGCDAAQNAIRVGDAMLAASYARDTPCDTGSGTRGRVAVLIETGSVTRKIEAGFTVPILTTDRYSNQNDFAKALYSRRNVQYNRSVSVKYWLRVALPALQDAPVPAHRTVVRVSSAENLEDKGVEVTAVRVEDLDAQARLAYAEKQPTVVMRAIARALAKYLATETASNQDQGLGALVNLLGVVTETADTRSWTTLPGSIDLARLDLEPGKYRIDVEVLDPQGALLVKRQFENVEVRSNGLEVRRVRLR
jgi:hypothetical protein